MKCLTPSRIARPDGFLQIVPCGHCLNCSIKRQLAWTIRILLEASTFASSSFVTLTYAEDTVPESLEYGHIQSFIRRLRKNTRGRVRFFCVGEYGKRTERPHWHLILFGLNQFDLMGSLTELWSRGHTHVGEVNQATASYTARYSLKSGFKGGEHVVQMSRNPGIGLDRIEEIGAYCASQTLQVAQSPSWWRIGKSLYALDHNSTARWQKGFEGAGGTVLQKDRSPLSLHGEARFYALLGDPLAADKNSIGLTKIDKKELERETF